MGKSDKNQSENDSEVKHFLCSTFQGGSKKRHTTVEVESVNQSTLFREGLRLIVQTELINLWSSIKNYKRLIINLLRKKTRYCEVLCGEKNIFWTTSALERITSPLILVVRCCGLLLVCLIINDEILI